MGMRFKILAAVVGSALSAIIFASPQAQAAACTSGTWASYLGLASCTIGNLQFSDFSFLAGGNTGVTAAQIGVAPITTSGDEGFEFNPAFNVTGTQISDAKLDFKVTALSGTISDLSIFFNGAFSGTGSTSFSETYCTTSFTTGCNVFQVTNPPTDLSKTIDIAPVTALFITKDINASGGGTGQASVSDVKNQFSQHVPEPASLAIFGTALAGLGLVGLRRRRKTL